MNVMISAKRLSPTALKHSVSGACSTGESHASRASERTNMFEQLPADLLVLAASDPDRRVRLVAAAKVPAEDLEFFLDDPDRAVRELAYARLIAVAKEQVSHLLASHAAF
ncbi:hypothetical protein LPB41_21120 [Thalassospira sp. MA62]|nr:hypothetical protein [Thalassospira sp. MA62]